MEFLFASFLLNKWGEALLSVVLGKNERVLIELE